MHYYDTKLQTVLLEKFYLHAKGRLVLLLILFIIEQSHKGLLSCVLSLQIVNIVQEKRKYFVP